MVELDKRLLGEMLESSGRRVEDMTRESSVCGRAVDRHVEQFAEYRDAGFDEIYVSNIGPHYKEFFAFYRDEVLPCVRP